MWLSPGLTLRVAESHIYSPNFAELYQLVLSSIWVFAIGWVYSCISLRRCFHLIPGGTSTPPLVLCPLQWMVPCSFGSWFAWISCLFLTELQEARVYFRTAHVAKCCLSASPLGTSGLWFIQDDVARLELPLNTPPHLPPWKQMLPSFTRDSLPPRPFTGTNPAASCSGGWGGIALAPV